MTLRSYLIFMISITAVCWLVWLFVIFTVNPETASLFGFVLFYLSLFLALAGSAAIVGFVIRFIALKKALAFRLVRDAFRQSFLFAFLISASLFLLSKNLFNWLNLFFLVAGLSALEFFMISYKKSG
jgi:hypothetical protein